MMGPPDWSGYIGGRIQRVDPDRGTVTDLYTECDGRPLRSPNDLVMHGHGGFWFTDTGIRDPSTRTADITGIHYAHTDGSAIREVVFPADHPTASACLPTGPRRIGPRPGAAASSAAPCAARASWRHLLRSTRPPCCTRCPASAPSTAADLQS